MLTKKLIPGLLVISLVFTSSCDVDSLTEYVNTSSQEELHHVDVKEQAEIDTAFSSDLYHEYRKNSIKADEDYYLKYLVVTGFVQEIGKDNNGDMYVDLTYGDIDEVRCYMLNSQAQALANLKNNAYVNIKGVCLGKRDFMLNKSQLGFAVYPTLMNSVLLEEPPVSPMCED